MFFIGGFALLIAVFASLSQNVSGSDEVTPEEFARFHHDLMAQNRAPIDSTEYFLPASRCDGCHGYDPTAYALVDESGSDISIFNDWRTSMMGLSAVDPLWRAKVSQEITINPGLADETQNFCTGCHAPMGHYTAKYHGQQYYTISDLVNDTLGLDGVSCGACHMIADSNMLGSVFSGQIPYDTNHVEYGPFTSPMTGPMDLYVGLTPVYSEHMNESKVCSPCHTLITNTLDLAGNPTGTTFVEQATYHEWLNSVFPSQLTTCQTCHMPQIQDPVVIAVGYLGLPPRTPFNIHIFGGANYFMVNLIKNFKNNLGLDSVADVTFDSTLANINRMLKYQTADVTILGTPFASNDSLYLDVEILNKAGHKFPSGYPSRRAVLQTVVLKSNGDTLFKSGIFDANGSVTNLAGIYEPHYDMINSESQAQIYQMVMGDVNGDKTTVLERAAVFLKDNRIPPQGFTYTHNAYDTIPVVANAYTDTDFNRNGATVGTGKDITHYHIPLNGYAGQVNIYTRVLYQTLPPDFLTEMFSLSTAPIDTFKMMYQSSTNNPIYVHGDSILNLNLNVGLTQTEINDILLYPNPVSNGLVYIKTNNDVIKSIEVVDLSGRLVETSVISPTSSYSIISLPQKSGTYIVRITTDRGTWLKKVVNLR